MLSGPASDAWEPGRIRVAYGDLELFLGSEVLGGDLIRRIAVTDGKGLEIEMTEEGARRLEDLTRRHLGKPIAILYEGRVLAAPVVRAVLGAKAAVNLSPEGLERLLSRLDGG